MQNLQSNSLTQISEQAVYAVHKIKLSYSYSYIVILFSFCQTTSG